MALFHVEGQVEISQHGAVLRLAPQGARPPQQPAADVPITPKAPSTRPSMADISRQARDGVIVIHDTRLPLTRGPYHRLVNNVARSEGLPTGVSGLWNAAAHTRSLRVLSEPVRESRRKPVLAVEDDDKISKDQAGNPPLAIQDIVGNNTKEDIVENNPVQNGTPRLSSPTLLRPTPRIMTFHPKIPHRLRIRQASRRIPRRCLRAKKSLSGLRIGRTPTSQQLG